MTMEKKARYWIQDGIVWCAFMLMGLLAIPAGVSFLMIAVVWQATEVLLNWLERRP